MCKHKYSAYCVDDIEDVATKDEESGNGDAGVGVKTAKNEATDANGVHPAAGNAVTSPLLNHDAAKTDDVDAKSDAEVAENAKATEEKLPYVSFSKPEQVTFTWAQSCKAFFVRISDSLDFQHRFQSHITHIISLMMVRARNTIFSHYEEAEGGI